MSECDCISGGGCVEKPYGEPFSAAEQVALEPAAAKTASNIDKGHTHCPAESFKDDDLVESITNAKNGAVIGPVFGRTDVDKEHIDKIRDAISKKAKDEFRTFGFMRCKPGMDRPSGGETDCSRIEDWSGANDAKYEITQKNLNMLNKNRPVTGLAWSGTFTGKEHHANSAYAYMEALGFGADNLEGLALQKMVEGGKTLEGMRFGVAMVTGDVYPASWDWYNGVAKARKWGKQDGAVTFWQAFAHYEGFKNGLWGLETDNFKPETLFGTQPEESNSGDAGVEWMAKVTKLNEQCKTFEKVCPVTLVDDRSCKSSVPLGDFFRDKPAKKQFESDTDTFGPNKRNDDTWFKQAGLEGKDGFAHTGASAKMDAYNDDIKRGVYSELNFLMTGIGNNSINPEEMSEKGVTACQRANYLYRYTGLLMVGMNEKFSGVLEQVEDTQPPESSSYTYEADGTRGTPEVWAPINPLSGTGGLNTIIVTWDGEVGDEVYKTWSVKALLTKNNEDAQGVIEEGYTTMTGDGKTVANTVKFYAHELAAAAYGEQVLDMAGVFASEHRLQTMFALMMDGEAFWKAETVKTAFKQLIMAVPNTPSQPGMPGALDQFVNNVFTLKDYTWNEKGKRLANILDLAITQKIAISPASDIYDSWIKARPQRLKARADAAAREAAEASGSSVRTTAASHSSFSQLSLPPTDGSSVSLPDSPNRDFLDGGSSLGAPQTVTVATSAQAGLMAYLGARAFMKRGGFTSSKKELRANEIEQPIAKGFFEKMQ